MRPENSLGRTFTGTDGRQWTVIEIVPRFAERRLNERRHPSEGGPSAKPLTTPGKDPASHVGDAASRAPERRWLERRRVREVRGPVTKGFEHGWLAFESANEKRRLAPVPPGWHQYAEETLRTLCQRALHAQRWRRRLIE